MQPDYPQLDLIGLAGHQFECVISQPWLDWTAEEDGDSRLVQLLKVHGPGDTRMLSMLS